MDKGEHITSLAELESISEKLVYILGSQGRKLKSMLSYFVQKFSIGYFSILNAPHLVFLQCQSPRFPTHVSAGAEEHCLQ